MPTAHSRRLKLFCALLSLSCVLACEQRAHVDKERESVSRFDKKGDRQALAHEKKEKPEPIEIKVRDVPLVNVVVSEEHDEDILVVLEPEEDEIAGPPKPEDYKPLPEQIQVQEHKVDDFENGAKELELEVRSKKVKDKVKNF